MKTGLMTLAALTIGVSVLAPTAARAGDFHDDRGAADRREVDVRIGREDYRDRDHDHDRRGPDDRRDIDVTIRARDVPPEVERTALRNGNGRHIEWARYVRRDGRTFYVVRMHGERKEQLNIHVNVEGRLIGIDRLDGR